jgi:Protein of unknown function (DUF3089)
MFGCLRRPVPARIAAVAVAVAVAAVAGCDPQAAKPDAYGVVWLCRRGMASDPCTTSLATTVVTATGHKTVTTPRPAASTPFDCFYVYGTVSRESSVNANLNRGQAEIDAAMAAAAPFSSVCKVYAPIYRQVTLAGLAAHPDLNFGAAESVTAYDSIRSGFEDFLDHYSRGRPFIVIGDSQGAAMLNMLLARLVDDNPVLRSRLVLAIILGGNVEVPPDKLVGGTFQHIPACSQAGQAGCVIAYSSFPSAPPVGALFGRPGQGVSLQSGQTATTGLQVVCVNPAALPGGQAALGSVFPSLGAVSTPWVAYPGRYTARCQQRDGASWLNVTKATGPGDHRPVVTEEGGPIWGYHLYDLPLAQDNLIADVTAAQRTWTTEQRG